MKKLLLPFIFSIALVQTHAQITLDQSNMPSNPTWTDTMYSVFNTGLPTVGPGTNILWNFTGVTYDNKIYVSAYAAEHGFTNATHSNHAYYDSAGVNPLHYETNLMFAIESAGIKTYGERLIRQAFLIQGAGPQDSVVILPQDVYYDMPLTTLKFPLTYGTGGTWTSVCKNTVNMEVTYTPGLYHTPSQKKSTVVVNNQVIGWGKLKMKMWDGNPSGSVDVLEVETITSTTDSFFVQGVPQSQLGPILSTMGLTQGQTNFVYTRNFYRAGEITPLASVSYKDAGHTQVKDVYLHRQRIPPFDEGVTNVNMSNDIKLYPNPIINHKVNIEISKQDNDTWEYQLLNTYGQLITKGLLQIANNKGVMDMPQGMSAGIYYIYVSNGEGAAGMKAISIQ